MRRGDHFDFRIALHAARQSIDQLRIDQRFIALNVDDVRNASQFRGHFRDAVGPAAVAEVRQANFRAPSEGGFRDAHVVRRDDHLSSFGRVLAAFPDVSQERLSGDGMERFAGKRVEPHRAGIMATTLTPPV